MEDLFGKQSTNEKEEIGRRTFKLKHLIAEYQSAFTIMEHCPQPVICSIQGPCIGGGVDMVLAADIRIASKQAWFSIKEVDIGLAADVGTLQRIEKLTGNSSLVRELAYTARNFSADEALSFGMISKVLNTQQELDEYAINLATQISSKSPIGIMGTKFNLNYSRDHTINDSLDHMSTWSSIYIQSDDVESTIKQSLNKTKQLQTVKYKNLS